MQVVIIKATSLGELSNDLSVQCAQGWKIQGGLAYGDGQWAVLLVKGKEEETPQYPYEPRRTMAYQEVAQGKLAPMSWQE